MVLLLATPFASLAAETDRNELSVAAPQVQQYLETAFPQEYEALGGLFTLTARIRSSAFRHWRAAEHGLFRQRLVCRKCRYAGGPHRDEQRLALRRS